MPGVGIGSRPSTKTDGHLFSSRHVCLSCGFRLSELLADALQTAIDNFEKSAKWVAPEELGRDVVQVEHGAHDRESANA